MNALHQEKELQREIAKYLEGHGWLHSSNSSGYDKERALFPEDVLGWLGDTDPDNFARIVPDTDNDAARAKGERRILDRIAFRQVARRLAGIVGQRDARPPCRDERLRHLPRSLVRGRSHCCPLRCHNDVLAGRCMGNRCHRQARRPTPFLPAFRAGCRPQRTR